MKLKPKSTTGSIIELVVIVAVALGLALGIQAFLVKPYRIPSESMDPTLKKGQRILVNRLGNSFNDPKLYQITVFHPPSGADLDSEDSTACGNPAHSPQTARMPCDRPTPKRSNNNFVKRIVGMPGDRLQVREGHVIRNGKPEKDNFVKNEFCAGPDDPGCNLKTITVPSDMYFMMGDNRAASLDSRYWGPVPKNWIIGGAFFTYWPPNRIGFL